MMEFENVLPTDIERRSFEIIESELPREIESGIKLIVKRVIHTTADFDYVDNLCFSENVVEISSLISLSTLGATAARITIIIKIN